MDKRGRCIPRHRWSPGLAFGILVAVALVALGSSFGVGHLNIQAAAANTVKSFGAASSAAGTTLSASSASGTPAGDLLVATISTRVSASPAATVVSVTDTGSNTWVRATPVAPGRENDEEIWYAANASSDTGVTVTLSSSAVVSFTVIEVARAATTAPLDRAATDTGSSAAPSISITTPTTQANEIVITDIGWNGKEATGYPATPTAGYTTTAVEQSSVSPGAAGEQAAWETLSAVGTPSYGATLSASVTWTGALATFDLAGTSPTPTPSPTATPTPTMTPPANPPHIMLIVEENRSYGDIIGSSSAPYINTLASEYASATNWYSVEHTSEYDYVDLISGSNQGLPVGKPYSATTLVDELHAQSIPWKAYMESLPSNCYNGAPPANGLYDQYHNGFHYFAEYGTTAGDWCSKANLSTEGVVPYTGSAPLVSALDATNAPDFVELIPNDCDEMHGDKNTGSPCATSTQPELISAGDTWLSDNLPAVIGSSWFAQNGIIIITWDEAASGDSSGCCGLSSPAGGHVPTIVVSSNNKGMGQFTGIGDHYGTLAAIEDAYGVPLLLNAANSANGNLSGAFGTPSSTGDISGTVMDASTDAGIVGASVTYSGSGGTASMATTTGGAYGFTDVPPGPYTVSVTAPGYTGQTSSTQTVTAGGSVTQNFALARILSVVESFGAANSGATGSTTLTATTATATGSGDLLAVAIRARGASAAPTVSGISDNSSGLNTWKRATGVAGKSGADAEIWYTTDAASVTSVTATVSGTAALAMTVLDISGASSTPLDQVMTDTGTGTTATTQSTPATTQANEIAVADIGWNGATNTYPLGGATAGYASASTAFWQSTVTSEQTGEEAAWEVLNATGAQSFAATLKASAAWTGVIATFG